MATSPVELCRVLLIGPVAAGEVPELNDEDVREEVRRRLEEVGCDLVYSPDADRWMARLAGPVPQLAGHEPVVWLSSLERAVLAICWLHLRFMPMERARAAGEGSHAPGEPGLGSASVDPTDLLQQLAGRVSEQELGIAIGNLLRAGFLARRDGRLFAGPLLDTIDELRAAEQARALIARYQRMAYLRRRSAHLSQQRGATGATG